MQLIALIGLFAMQALPSPESTALQSDEAQNLTTIGVSEGRVQPDVSEFTEIATLPHNLRFSVKYNDHGSIYSFLIWVDGKTYRISIPKNMFPELDIDSKSVSPTSPRRREISMRIEFGKPLFDCPDGPRDMLIIRAGPEASVERWAYEKNCILRPHEMSAKSGVIVQRLAHP